MSYTDTDPRRFDTPIEADDIDEAIVQKVLVDHADS